MGYEQFTLVTYQTVKMFPLGCPNIVSVVLPTGAIIGIHRHK